MIREPASEIACAPQKRPNERSRSSDPGGISLDRLAARPMERPRVRHQFPTGTGRPPGLAPAEVGASPVASPQQQEGRLSHVLVIEGSDRPPCDRMTQMGCFSPRAASPKGWMAARGCWHMQETSRNGE